MAIKYNLSKGVLSRWLHKWYNGLEIKDYISNGDTDAMETRETTVGERLEIVKRIINNNGNYKRAANKYDLNYYGS